MKRIITSLLAFTLVATGTAMPVSAAESASLNISSSDESYSISDKLYGSFIEDISYACDGGLVSNLVNNDSFEYEFNKLTGWTADGITLESDNQSPVSKNNPSYAKITAAGNGTLTNTGYTEMYDYKTYDRNEKRANTPDMGFEKDVNYTLSFYAKNIDFDGDLSVYLKSSSNMAKKVVVKKAVASKADWTKIDVTMTSIANEDGGLTFEFNGNGTMLIDFVTLTPQNSYGYGTENWKYTTLRPDLYQALKELNPAFIRFPGGCLAEGDSLEHLYNWKDTIGALEDRTQFYNLWRDDYGRDYINTNAMGYHEYFQLCDDLNAKALPILNVGLTCQARCQYDDHVAAKKKLTLTDSQWQDYLINNRHIAKEDIESYTKTVEDLNIKSDEDFENYLDTIALRPGTKEWKSYVQDILDLIEYANGDATTTYWGALRAANGHTEPFNLEYIGLGNENWGEVYERNFKALYKEVKKAYPKITVISSSGTYLEGDAYEENWDFINKDYTDTIVDEHYYTTDGYLFNHNDRYDNFDRNGAHVFVGEYAATAKGVGTIQTKSNMLEAVEEASYLNSLERNGDLVEMASYAPTFAKVNAQCWNVNLIWFDSRETVLTPSYYVQMLYSNNYGSKYIKSTFDNKKTDKNGIYESVTADEKSQTLYVKLVNTTGEKQSVSINLDGYNANKVSIQSINSTFKSACNEIGKNTTYPTETSLNASNNINVDMGKYDVSVVRIAYGDNDGSALYKLPSSITTQAKTSKYLPTAIKVAVPASIGGAIVIIGAITIIVKALNKKKKGKLDK